MKRFLMAALALAGAVMLTGCSSQPRLYFDQVEDVSFVPWTSVTVNVSVNNAYRSGVEIDGFIADVFYRTHKIGTLTLDHPMAIPFGYNVIRIPLNINLSNVLSAATLLGDADKGSDLVIDYQVDVRMRGVRRTIVEENVPLSTLVPKYAETAGALPAAISNLLK